MKAVTYITENTIMKFLYNPKKTFLEGFVKEWLCRQARIRIQQNRRYRLLQRRAVLERHR